MMKFNIGDELLDLGIDVNKEQPVCNGTVFKAVHNTYRNKRGDIVSQVKLVHQKRLSCSGCVQCGNDDEAIQLEINEGLILCPDELKDGEYYKLSYASYKTGSYDCEEWDYELEFNQITI